ncbi:unnamed protein product [Adineta steineri]|nr:unnamed protein product [Adineta steineri]
MDTNKSLYIVDHGNNRIVLWLLGSTSGRVIAGTGVGGVLPSQLNNPYYVRLDSTGALIINDWGNNRTQRFPVLCSPNTMSSSTTSIGTTSQNTTMAVPLTINNLTTSANNPITILSASTSIANSVTVSATVSTSTLVTTSQKNSSTNTITKLLSTSATSSLSTNHSFATRNLNSKLLLLLFCFIMIFINN